MSPYPFYRSSWGLATDPSADRKLPLPRCPPPRTPGNYTFLQTALRVKKSFFSRLGRNLSTDSSSPAFICLSVPLRKESLEFSLWFSGLRNPTSIHEDAGLIPGLSGLRIQHCHKVWCRSQTWLGSGIAMAVATVTLIRALAQEFPYAKEAHPHPKKRSPIPRSGSRPLNPIIFNLDSTHDPPLGAD